MKTLTHALNPMHFRMCIELSLGLGCLRGLPFLQAIFSGIPQRPTISDGRLLRMYSNVKDIQPLLFNTIKLIGFIYINVYLLILDACLMAKACIDMELLLLHAYPHIRLI